MEDQIALETKDSEVQVEDQINLETKGLEEGNLVDFPIDLGQQALEEVDLIHLGVKEIVNYFAKVSLQEDMNPAARISIQILLCVYICMVTFKITNRVIIKINKIYSCIFFSFLYKCKLI